jgi:hypothetical protein
MDPAGLRSQAGISNITWRFARENYIVPMMFSTFIETAIAAGNKRWKSRMRRQAGPKEHVIPAGF